MAFISMSTKSVGILRSVNGIFEESSLGWKNKLRKITFIVLINDI